MNQKRELSDIIISIQYQLKAIIRKMNIDHQYIDSDDLYQEALLYLWQENERGGLNDKNDSYILQGSYYYLKNYLRKKLKTYSRSANRINGDMIGRGEEDQEGSISNSPFCNHQKIEEYLFYDEFNRNLSLKEKRLLHLRIRGLTNREIGRELGISHTMVSKMRKKLMDKYQSFNQD